MIIGIPKETKRDEYRVGLLPVGADELTRAGHQVLVETGAGLGSGLADTDYLRHGAELVAGPQDLYARADMVLKVKEPQAAERPLLRRGQIVFAYFHLAADRQLAEDLLAGGVTAVAYETLRDDHGSQAVQAILDSEVERYLGLREENLPTDGLFLPSPWYLTQRDDRLGNYPVVAPATNYSRTLGLLNCPVEAQP